MNKLREGTIIGIILFIGLINSVLALSCTPSSFTQSYTEGSIPIDFFTISNCNNINGSITPITISDSHFTLESNTIGNEQKDIKIKIASNIDADNYTFWINFGGTILITSNIIINPNVIQPTNQISFPTSKTINVQQGSDYDKKITMILPTSYPNPINIQTIEFSEESDIISLGDVETGTLNPGEIKDIPLVIHSKNAQVGEYPPISVIVRYGDNGLVKTISSVLHIIVTANLNPTTNSTFSIKPSCSISASVMNLNDTYQFTCSNVQKNLEINPVYSDYFEGINTVLNGDIYSYYFKPIRFGNVEFVSTFRYLGAPIFSPFKQEIKIASSGSSVPGTDLKIMFIPDLSKARPGEKIILNLVDNKTNNLVNGAEMFIDYLPLNTSDGYTFFYSFDLNRNFFIRARSPGYNDLILENVSLTSQEMSLIISPSSGDSNTDFNITTDANASIFLDGTKLSDGNYFGRISSGTHVIKAIAEGYYDKELNFTVGAGLYASLGSEFKKSAEQLIFLSRNCTWKLTYLKKTNSNETILTTGNSSEIRFTPEKSGIYKVYCEDTFLSSYEIKGWSWKNSYLLWGLIPLGILALYLVIKKGGSESSSMPGLAGNINYG